MGNTRKKWNKKICRSTDIFMYIKYLNNGTEHT